MNALAAHFKWVMLVSGALTCTMIYAAVSPGPALRSMFGATLDGQLAEIVVRNWGALIALVGAMLIYGAFNPPVRTLVLVVAGASKLVFIGLVLAYGRERLAGQLGFSIGVDLLMVALFAAYLLRARSG